MLPLNNPMSGPSTTDVFALLAAQGLHLQAVFDLGQLPDPVVSTLNLSETDLRRYTQLILIGQVGRDFWTALQRRGLHGSDPVDAFASECVRAWMGSALAGHVWRQVFPGPHPVPLQKLGALAGWHQPSPFWVGVDAEWGSWFAYRAVVLADTRLPATPRREQGSPCLTCANPPCINACPVGALNRQGPASEGLHACLVHRMQPASACLDRCLARNACPVGVTHRYTEGQTTYHYLQSMPAIRAFVQGELEPPGG
jgi:epoxyqueuosine reductase